MEEHRHEHHVHPRIRHQPDRHHPALGRELRLRRLFGADGRTLTVALDQAVPRGVAPRLATIGSTFASIADGEPDAVTITKGLAGPLLGGNARRCRGS